MLKQTPLNDEHRRANAHFIDFHGWQMPLHYGSALQEHRSVRTSAGLFDVSHMTIVDLLGAGVREFLRYLLPNDVDKMVTTGAALYTTLLTHRGGVIDDALVYFRAPDSYRLVFNCATQARVIAWLEQHIGNFSLGFQQRNDLVILACQGSQALAKAQECLPPELRDATATLQPFASTEFEDWFIARTGYTGEDGLEIMLPATQAHKLWGQLLAAEISPCGLAARDSLRLEAGLLLSGQDIDESVTPLESSLGWTVAWQPSDRDFIGKAALLLQKEQGVKRKLVGLVCEKSQGVMRSGQIVTIASEAAGVITSGGYSPTLDCSIALARVPSDCPPSCQVTIRQDPVTVRVVPPRFVKHGKSLI